MTEKKPSNYDEVVDAKMQKKVDEAYKDASRIGPDTSSNSDPLHMTKTPGGKAKRMAKGGSASSRADGIASKGKTRGKMC